MKLSNLIAVASLDAQRSRLRAQLAAVLAGKLELSVQAHRLDDALCAAATPCVATWLARRISDIDDLLEDLNVEVDD